MKITLLLPSNIGFGIFETPISTEKWKCVLTTPVQNRNWHSFCDRQHTYKLNLCCGETFTRNFFFEISACIYVFESAVVHSYSNELRYPSSKCKTIDLRAFILALHPNLSYRLRLFIHNCHILWLSAARRFKLLLVLKKINNSDSMEFRC